MAVEPGEEVVVQIPQLRRVRQRGPQQQQENDLAPLPRRFRPLKWLMSPLPIGRQHLRRPSFHESQAVIEQRRDVQMDGYPRRQAWPQAPQHALEE